MPASRPTLSLVTPEEWRRRTSLRLSRRSLKVLAIDTAYDTYHGHRTQGNALDLFVMLEAYLREHEGRWAKVDRNTASGGLMEFVHGLARQHSGAPGVAATHPKHVLEAQAAHARLGVLYLFSNTEISTEHAAIFLEGAFSVTGKGAELIPAAGAFQAYGQGLHATQLVAPGAAIGGGVAKHVAGTSATVGNAPMAPVSRTVTIHRRRGAIVQGSPHAPVVPPPPPPRPSATGKHWAPVGVLLDAGSAAYDGAAYVGRLGSELVQYLWRQIKDFVNWTIAKIQQSERTAWQVTGTVITSLVKAAVAHIAKAVAPLVGGLIDIGRGVMQIVSAAKSRIEAALLRRRFDIQAGHPQALASAIESAMNWAIGSGIWTTLKGCASTGLTFISAGASTIGEVIAAGLEFVAKTILRIRESMKMKTVLTEAKAKYAECSEPSTNRAESTSVQVKAGSLITKTEEFTQMYEGWCEASPCIPMLTLNSGVCGDLMQLMKMFDDTTSAGVVSQEAFNAGAEYFTSFKQFGRKYLRESGFQFTSGNATVRGLLHHALEHHQEGSVSAADAVLSVLGGG